LTVCQINNIELIVNIAYLILGYT